MSAQSKIHVLLLLHSKDQPLTGQFSLGAAILIAFDNEFVSQPSLPANSGRIFLFLSCDVRT
ncbi:hypothetical protein WT60_05040 [Burkholderia sp. MSMB617WGS]|nr:hypothetical protein WT60_05040 [Burkholderia sp. MSMB617WGS]